MRSPTNGLAASTVMIFRYLHIYKNSSYCLRQRCCCAFYLDQVAGMVAKHHCFSCRFGTTEVKWQNADVRFKCGASSGFASLKRFSCWDCYMKHRLCICGNNHCNMKADFLSSWCHRRLKEIRNDANSKFNARHTMTGWNADVLDVSFKWQNQWQRWCNQFQ